MPAEGAFMGDFGGRRVDITDGAKYLRGHIAFGREGSIIRWPKVLEEVLPRLRRQRRGEIGMLVQENMWWHDSLHIAKDEKGFAADNMSQGLQVRLDNTYGNEEGVPLIVIVDLTQLQMSCANEAAREEMRKGVMPDDYTPSDEPVEIDFFNQVAIMRQLWLKQPYGKVRDAITYRLRELIKFDVPHIRPEMKRVFEGLPPKFNPLIRAIWQLSDIRFRRMVATVRSHGIGGIRGLDFGTIGKAVDDGYGQGYDTKVNQFRRVMSLMELPLWNKYGDRIRGYVEAYTGAHSTWTDYDEFLRMVGGDLRQRAVNLDALRIALGFLKVFGVIPADWLIKLKNDNRVSQMENWFALLEGRLLSDHQLMDEHGQPVTYEREIDGHTVDWPVFAFDGEGLIDQIEREEIYKETPFEADLIFDIHSQDPDKPTEQLLLEEPDDNAPVGVHDEWSERMRRARYEVENTMYQQLA